jgi:hypothetical protein
MVEAERERSNTGVTAERRTFRTSSRAAINVALFLPFGDTNPWPEPTRPGKRANGDCARFHWVDHAIPQCHANTPATLRLTGENDDISRGVKEFAHVKFSSAHFGQCVYRNGPVTFRVFNTSAYQSKRISICFCASSIA